MKPLIVALDVETSREAKQIVRHLGKAVDVFKIGPVLFLKYGSDLLKDIHKTGAQVFLDLKFHDIPSVVAKAVNRASEWGVYSLTVHTAGGTEMMRQAAAVPKRPKLWGVTVLTSLDKADLKSIGVSRALPAQVSALAQLAKEAGLDGIVSSVEEAAMTRRASGPFFDIVTPGIRLQSGGDDQKRACTPVEAIRHGVSFFVMGRPIVDAKDPAAAVKSVYQSIGVNYER